MIGDHINSFRDQLPTGLDVIKLYCSEWNSRRSETEKISMVVNSILDVWEHAVIPVRSKSSIRLKIQNIVDRFKSLMRTRLRSTAAQVKKENDFLMKYQCLFDIVDCQSEFKLCETKKSFLKDQRNERVQQISDLNLSVNLNGSLELSNYLIDNTSDNSENCSEPESDDDSGSLYDPSSSDDEIVPKKKKKLKRATIQKMDKAGPSFRQMQKVAAAFIEEFGSDPREYCIAVSTFHSNSTKIRDSVIKEMSYEMQHRDSKLVILFDTKSCKQLNAALGCIEELKF